MNFSSLLLLCSPSFLKDSPDLIGDILCCCFCGYCTMCQILRTVDRSTWDWMAKMGNMGYWVPPLVFAFVGFLLVALGLYARRRNPAAIAPLPDH